MSPKKTVLCQKGFSLIELSIVLVVMGLLMTAGVGLMRSTMKTSKMAKEKANIAMIKNSLISYAASHGRLPCPDIDGDGSGDRDTLPSTSCKRPTPYSPPYGLPYIDLNISSVSKDAWSRPYGYDADTYLTIADSSNLCSTLYQLSKTKRWLEDADYPRTCGARYHVCVTNTSDVDNGRIDGVGYYLAAYVLSGGENKEFTGKNDNTDREYEMSSNPYVADDEGVVEPPRDDLVGELSFGEMKAKICNANNTTIKIGSVDGGDFFHDNTCISNEVSRGDRVALGKFVYIKKPPPSGECSQIFTFDQLANCDAGFPVTDCNNGAWYDGEVEL
ncbi:MAG: type II secretion system protein [Desulfocapsa sp.]|nr:type II secretion system protein [Desulfocapsa sp.]